MTRLPTPGGDDGTWGEILNSFLSVSLNTDGSINTNSLIQAGAITSINSLKPSNGSITLQASDVGALTQSNADLRYTQISNLGQKDGIATLDSSGNVPIAQLSNVPSPPVTSVNSKTGAVNLTYTDVGADPAGAAAQAQANSLPLAGGTLSGNLNVDGEFYINQLALGDYLFEYNKYDGTNLLKALWDGTNFHHYLGGNINYNLEGYAIIMDGNSNNYSIFAIECTTWLNAGSGNINLAVSPTAYASSTTPLTTSILANIETWAWNGTNGYSIHSGGYYQQVQLSANNGDAQLEIGCFDPNNGSQYNLLTLKYLSKSVYTLYNTLDDGMGNMVLKAGISKAIKTITSNYTVLNSDSTILINSTSAINVTLPDATSLNGRIFTLKNINTGNVTVLTTSSQTIDGAASQSIATQYSKISIQSDGTNWWII